MEIVLKFLNEKYGDKRIMLNNKDVQELTGFKYEYVRAHYMPQGERFVSAAVLARALS